MGGKELGYVLVLGLAGLVLAALVILAPWYPQGPRPGTTVVEVVTPGGFAGQP